MEIRKIWLLLVHHDFQAFGSRFFVHIDTSGMIYDLREKIKEKKPEALFRAHVDPDELTVWKTKGEMVFYYSTSKTRLAEILKSIDVDDVDTIEEISESEELADLELFDGQTLLVRLPGSSRISTAVSYVLMHAIGDTSKESQLIGKPIKSKVDENYKYKDLFLRANTKGKFTSGDISLNEIIYVDESNPDDPSPQFVKDLETTLSRKRKLGNNVGYFRVL